jgi:integrase
MRIWREFFARKHIRFLECISPAVVDEFRVEVLNGKKPKTVKNYINILKTALNKAVEWDLIESNPIAKVKPPKTVKTFRFFSHEEIDKLLREADDPLRTGIFILVSTGMRKGELFHLRWRDVDLNNDKIRIWPYGSYSPKGKRPRSVPISENLRHTMLKLSKDMAPDDFVCRPFKCIHRLYKRFVVLLKKLGMEGTLHDLRHTYASHLAMNGTPIPVIKELLGHADIATTMIYSHLSPELHKTAVDKLPFGV